MGSRPQRIQRKRTKGWRKPDNTVIVDRTSRWGNPFRVGDFGIPDNEAAVVKFEQWLAGLVVGSKPPSNEEIIKALRGKNLCCSCPPDQPCHADVLLEIANG